MIATGLETFSLDAVTLSMMVPPPFWRVAPEAVLGTVVSCNLSALSSLVLFAQSILRTCPKLPRAQAGSGFCHHAVEL